jgi:PAS domain S-box-containing protein
MPEKQHSRLRDMPRPLRWSLGLVPAVLSLGIMLLLAPDDRSPYLIAYPGVVLSAWFLGLGGGAVCAIASAFMIEYLVYITHFLPHSIHPQGSILRLCIFTFGSLMAGWVVERASWLRQRAQTLELRRQLDKIASDRQLSDARSTAAAAVRERETRLQMALEGGHVGLWDNDLETGRVLWSDEHYRILGYEPGAVSAGYETMQRVIHPEDLAAMDALFNETRLSGSDFCCEYRVVWPDGTVRWVEAQSKYETDAQGKSVRMLGVIADITHRKQAEAALLRTEKLAIAGRLAASIAHEINNPLEAVANLLYLIARQENLDEVHIQAEQALAEVMRVSRITQQTLKFHRQSEAARRTRISEVIEGVIELFRGRLTACDIQIDHRYLYDPEFECFAGDLRQVFANLISNAIEAMSGTGGRLVIRIRGSHDWRNSGIPGLRITLLDTGCGMDRATRHRIYEPFFTTKKESGTGLGLWVVSEIIDRQQGDLRVWSSEIPARSGTAFSLFLPLAGAAPDPAPRSPLDTTYEKILRAR